MIKVIWVTIILIYFNNEAHSNAQHLRDSCIKVIRVVRWIKAGRVIRSISYRSIKVCYYIDLDQQEHCAQVSRCIKASALTNIHVALAPAKRKHKSREDGNTPHLERSRPPPRCEL